MDGKAMRIATRKRTRYRGRIGARGESLRLDRSKSGGRELERKRREGNVSKRKKRSAGRGLVDQNLYIGGTVSIPKAPIRTGGTHRERN